MYPNYITYLHPLTINTPINDGISINQQWAPTPFNPFNPFNLPHHSATAARLRTDALAKHGDEHRH